MSESKCCRIESYVQAHVQSCGHGSETDSHKSHLNPPWLQVCPEVSLSPATLQTLRTGTLFLAYSIACHLAGECNKGIAAGPHTVLYVQ